MSLLIAWLVALLALVAILVAPFVVAPLRRTLISKPLLLRFRRVMPRMSQTEREALEAGTVSFDGELFTGRPAWRDLLSIPRSKLTADEQHFLDHEVETLCAMVSDWETTNDEILLRRLAPFLLAGLTAPLPDLSAVTRELDGEPKSRRR